MLEAARAYIDANQGVIGLALLGLMFLGFIIERFPAAVVAVLGTCAFLMLGILSAESLFSVFSNPAPITIGAMFVLTGALMRTGIIDAIADLIITRAKAHPRLATAELFLGVLIASAFMNNTPVVLIMIPIMSRLAKATGYSSKRLLIPLSYMAILGGTTTLIGTSTNLLVDAVAREEGMPAFGIFDITPFGLVAALAGGVTLILLGPMLLPKGTAEKLYGAQEEADFITEMLVHGNSDAIGRALGELALTKRSGVKPVAVKRGGRFLRHNLENHIMEAGDHLIVRLSLAELLSLRSSKQFEIGLASTSEIRADSQAIVEATIAPSHPSLGQRLAEIPFLSTHKVRILGLTRHRNLPGPDLPGARMRAADRLLVTGSHDAVRHLHENPYLLGVGETRARAFRRDKAPIAVGALAAVVLLSALDILPIAVAAILGVGAILIARCIDAEEAWSSIDGNVLVLIFAMLAVGLGLERAGSVSMIVSALTPLLLDVPPWALIFAVYALSVLLTEVVTNNAVAIIVTPVVIALARDLGTDPLPLVLAVMFAASASFATPIGYQTNTLVYAAGNYRFTDFFKAGIPLTFTVGMSTCIAIALLA